MCEWGFAAKKRQHQGDHGSIREALREAHISSQPQQPIHKYWEFSFIHLRLLKSSASPS